MRALREREPRPEDPEKTRQSQEYWARVRREREALTGSSVRNPRLVGITVG
jgi:hypothetical protein